MYLESMQIFDCVESVASYNVSEADDLVEDRSEQSGAEQLIARDTEYSKDDLQRQIQEMVQRLEESSRRERQLTESKTEFEQRLQEMTREQPTTRHSLDSRMQYRLSVLSLK